MTIHSKIRLAQQYDSPDTTAVIATYPGRVERSIQSIDAIASYTDHLMRSFIKSEKARGHRVLLLTQKTDNDEAWYTERDSLVTRVWKKSSVFAFFDIIKTLLFHFSNVKNIVIQFEFHQFGGNINTGLFPIFLVLLRLMGKNVTLVMHQVVTDINTLSGHVNIKKGSLRYYFFQTMLTLFYKTTSYLAPTLITHNAILKKRLTEVSGREDITVIPHGLGAIAQKFSKRKARAILKIPKNQKVILSFGFLTWYKGADWLVHTMAESRRRNIHLMMAGGRSPNLADHAYYQTYADGIENEAARSKNITVSGFVEDQQLALYYAAADLVVLPYRTLMSSSGPFAMAVNFKKPFIFSHALAPYMQDDDIRGAMKTAQLTARDMTFNLTAQSFWSTLDNAMKKTTLKKLTAFSELLHEQRTWTKVAQAFSNIITTDDWESSRKSAILKQGKLPGYAA
jgi:glycosyltransferase involved in cell wall biosynthesis